MPRLLAILILLAPAALAREPFPSDYKPSPCAQRAKVCRSFPQSQIADVAGLRGWDIGSEWVNKHWAALTGAMEPMCEKFATCMATPGNDWLFCNDVLAIEAKTICERYPDGSKDREKCTYFMNTYLHGIDRNSGEPWREMQACAAQQPKSAQERTFEYWMVPATFDASYPGHFTVYAIDTETRVPVQARLHITSKEQIRAEDVADGLPTTFYKVPWKISFVRVPNAQGHRDLVAPEVRIEAPGYKTQSFTLPVNVPKMNVAMNPPLAKLKRGRNTVTITAVDAATGKPVEARVMGGHAVLGKTNEPFELEIKKGEKRPEIWVTNLFERYSDVVVAPAQ